MRVCEHVTPAVCLRPLTQVFKQPWPGVMRTVYGSHERFESTYFKKFPGYYVTGDGEQRVMFDSTLQASKRHKLFTCSLVFASD